MAIDITPSEEKKSIRDRLAQKRVNFKANHPLLSRIGTEVAAGAAYGVTVVGVLALGLMAGSKMSDGNEDEEEE